MKNRFWLLQPWITLLFRLILGGVLLAAGGLKVGHLQKSAMAVRAYEVLPISVANVIGYSLPWIEVGLAIFLILGVFVKQSAMASGALMFIFILGIAQAGIRGLSIDCGCFGGGGQVAAGQTKYLAEIFRDVGLLAIALALTKFPGGKFGLDRQ
ncbi:MAG: DoxX family membrane protein [Actinobacteria bacterium]|jgi:uncharacterized membrane protein YphA (DoxX/SURF4 family)|nr:DoxX family membrane protein [Actinomycetota bacterium]NDH12850.1 DoxX family membrane protein [Actinomycetota bacterium]TRZ86004.1 MAG: DoxX family membrane protein [Streptomycetaceae bacterium]